MKKNLLFLATMSLVFLGSCENEPSKEPEPEPPQVQVSSLAGTTWEGMSLTYGEGDTGLHENKLVFTTTSVDVSHIFNRNVELSFTGTYTYDPPVVTIKDTDGVEYEGTVGEREAEPFLEIIIQESRFLVKLIPNETEKQ